MKNQKSPRLFILAHSIDLVNRPEFDTSSETASQSARKKAIRFRGIERRFISDSPATAGEGSVDALGKFILVPWQPPGQEELLFRFPKWKFYALEEELSLNNASTVQRLISNNKFREGDRPALILLLQQRGHLVLGEFVIHAKGEAKTSLRSAA